MFGVQTHAGFVIGRLAKAKLAKAKRERPAWMDSDDEWEDDSGAAGCVAGSSWLPVYR